jgi:exonuclease III
MNQPCNTTDFKAWSLNVRGLNNRKKRRALFRLIKKNGVQIETYSSESVKNIWRNEWGGKIIWAHGASNSRGVAILVKPGFDFEVLSEFKDDSGRLLIVKAKVQDSEITFVNVYAPNSEDSQTHLYRYMYMKNTMSKLIDDNGMIMMGGDFNLIMSKELDRKGGTFRETAKYKEVKNTMGEIVNKHDLVDVRRSKNPYTKRFTWRRKTPTIHSRLDYWFISAGLQDSTDSVGIMSSVHSDHSAITIQIKGSDFKPKGRGYWKLNNSLISEEPYVRGILTKKTDWEAEATALTDPREKWEYIKYKIRQFSVKYGKERARNQRTMEQTLHQQLTTLEAKLDEEHSANEDTSVTETKINDTKAELEVIVNRKVEGLILRSGANWHEKGERSNKYFLTLETRNKIRKTINKLEDENEQLTTDPATFVQLQANFYEQLYISKTTKNVLDIENYLKDITVTGLTDEDKNESVNAAVAHPKGFFFVCKNSPNENVFRNERRYVFGDYT